MALRKKKKRLQSNHRDLGTFTDATREDFWTSLHWLTEEDHPIVYTITGDEGRRIWGCLPNMQGSRLDILYRLGFEPLNAWSFLSNVPIYYSPTCHYHYALPTLGGTLILFDRYEHLMEVKKVGGLKQRSTPARLQELVPDHY